MDDGETTILSGPEGVVTLNEVFEGFKAHFNNHRTSTELTMLELLRSTHPEFHVTCTSAQGFDLFGFATAGHASVKLDCDEATMDATRTYKSRAKGATSDEDEAYPRVWYDTSGTPSASRLTATEGDLRNHLRFGRWRYFWEAHEYILYEVEYPDPRGMLIKLYFILSPRSKHSAKEGPDSLTDQLLLAVGGWSTQLHDEIYVFDDGYWSKSQELWKSVQGASWDEVILDPAMKDTLIKDVQGFFDNEQLYKGLSVPWKRGVILWGVPGNGKTISIKALINSLGQRPEPIPSLYVKSFDACEGEKHSISSIFSHARNMAPCLLIFEDLDSIVTDETRSYFLNEVDGLESNDGILMIGSTNHLSKLDPAISKRPSRFDRKYQFNIPGLMERILYCQFWQKKLAGSEMVDFQDGCCEVIAKLTEGFSFAYLKELFVVVLLTIARGGTGDEVDVKEKKEAEQKEEDKKEEGTASVVEESKSEDGHVVVEHEDATAESSDSANKEEEAETPAKVPKVKRVVPEVDIPEGLQDNVLLKVVRGQIKMLIDEMDDTEETESTSEKKQPA